MKRIPLMLAAALALLPAPLTAQGSIGTIERGYYVCELPGDATGKAGVEQPDENFTIASASRYRSAKGDGIYLRRGDKVIFTSGPRQGESYQVIGSSFLRRMDGDKPGRLRCVRG